MPSGLVLTSQDLQLLQITGKPPLRAQPYHSEGTAMSSKKTRINTSSESSFHLPPTFPPPCSWNELKSGSESSITSTLSILGDVSGGADSLSHPRPFLYIQFLLSFKVLLKCHFFQEDLDDFSARGNCFHFIIPKLLQDVLASFHVIIFVGTFPAKLEFPPPPAKDSTCCETLYAGGN